MNASDFASSIRRRYPTSTGTLERAAQNEAYPRGAASPALIDCSRTDNDGDGFLRVVEQPRQIVSHRELYELAAKRGYPALYPHQVLISAWGDFHDQRLQRDVISPSPGCARAC